MRVMDASAITEPAAPPAPGEEQHPALALVNSTVALTGGRFADYLGTPSGADRWLAEHDLAPADAGLQEICAGRLRSMREQIRTLFASRVAALPAPPAALSAVNDALSGAPAAPLLRWDEQSGFHRATPHPTDRILDHALAVLAADAADLLTGADAERLTACGSTPCTRYLLRHGRRHWCSTRCGDRARAARAYARRTRPETTG
ncbi:CGNR zinc finger domain-containing protein [Streptomyces sp. SAS_272]|uniref:CGNR zinc finger domain-containing protein n=1 Tax=Streptomyces sp. SAS_272 TaxID=3412747 RepID=UPI00403CF4A8